MPAKRKASSASSSATIGFEAKLWLTADKLRNNMDAVEPSGARQPAVGSPKDSRVHPFYAPSCVVRCLFDMFVSYKEVATIRQRMVENDLWQKTPTRPLSGTNLHAS